VTSADWWTRVVQARTQRDDLRPHRVRALRKDGSQAAIDVKAVPGIGAAIVLTVDGELRKTRLFRSHEQAELGGAIADNADNVSGVGKTSLFNVLSLFWPTAPGSRVVRPEARATAA
jgi:hypothetical protein